MARSGRIGLLIAALGLVGCAEPEPLGPDATAAEIYDACEAGDLDACSRAARQRSSQYEAAVTVY